MTFEEVDKSNLIFLSRDKNFIYIKVPKIDVPSLRYDLKVKKLEKHKEGKWVYCGKQYKYFQGFGIHSLICQENHFLEMIRLTSKLNPSCHSIATFLDRLHEALIYENYIRQGVLADYEVSRNYYNGWDKKLLSKPLEWYPKNVISFFKKHEIVVNSRMESAFVDYPKIMPQLIQCMDEDPLINGRTIRDVFNLVFYRGSLPTLINEYNYELKALYKYLTYYLPNFENCEIEEGATLLDDYYRMASLIGRNVKKYPKYLKSMHDIIKKNYEVYKEKYDEELFEKMMKPELLFEDSKFIVVNPKCSKDIVKEGTDLNHCVGSYVKNILSGYTYIMFLRLKEKPDESLITLEYKNGCIVQAKGQYNRPCTEDELKFLQKYCKEKKMELRL